MKTHALTIKIRAKKPKNTSNCERSVSTNQEAAKKNIGDCVEISGEVDPHKMTVKVDALKFLDSNQAMCAAPPKKNQTKQP